MWKSFENIGLQTSEKVSWEKKKKETCAKHKIDRSQNGRSNKTPLSAGVIDSDSTMNWDLFQYKRFWHQLLKIVDLTSYSYGSLCYWVLTASKVKTVNGLVSQLTIFTKEMRVSKDERLLIGTCPSHPIAGNASGSLKFINTQNCLS